VLYQLTVGKLPFEGKNPHEVLKRIAECRFVDPRQANPRIGNRLGRIILRAMAAQPADRFPAIGEMVVALEAYLDESGIAHDRVAGELGRYFQAPAAYEQALKERMVDHLTRRGQQLLASDERAAALDVFDRVLTIDAHNARVLDIIAGIHRRRRLRANAIAAAAIAVVGAGAWVVQRANRPPAAEPLPSVIDHAAAPAVVPRQAAVAHLEVPAAPNPSQPAPIGLASAAPDPATLPPPHPAGAEDTRSGGNPASPARAQGSARGASLLNDAGMPLVAQRTQVRVSPAKDAEYAVDSGPRKPVPSDGVIHLELTTDAEVHVFSLSKCCQEDSKVVRPGSEVTIIMPYLPGRVLPACAENPAAEVRVNGVSANLGRTFSVPIGDSTDETKNVDVEFLGDRVDPTPIKVTVEAGKTRDVKCLPAP
jgi:serine/threonine-protein kinase